MFFSFIWSQYWSIWWLNGRFSSVSSCFDCDTCWSVRLSREGKSAHFCRMFRVQFSSHSLGAFTVNWWDGRRAYCPFIRRLGPPTRSVQQPAARMAYRCRMKRSAWWHSREKKALLLESAPAQLTLMSLFWWKLMFTSFMVQMGYVEPFVAICMTHWG